MIEALCHLWDPDGYDEVPYSTKRNSVLFLGGHTHSIRVPLLHGRSVPFATRFQLVGTGSTPVGMRFCQIGIREAMIVVFHRLLWCLPSRPVSRSLVTQLSSIASRVTIIAYSAIFHHIPCNGHQLLMCLQSYPVSRSSSTHLSLFASRITIIASRVYLPADLLVPPLA